MPPAIHSSFSPLWPPELCGEVIGTRLFRLAEILNDFRPAIWTGREDLKEPRRVTLNSMLEGMVTSVFREDDSQRPGRLEISLEEGGINQQVRVAVDCRPVDPAIECWEDPPERVLLNLLVTAARAADAAGDDRRKHVKIRGDSGKIRIVVRNVGEEFPDAVLSDFRRSFHLRTGLLWHRPRDRTPGRALA